VGAVCKFLYPADIGVLCRLQYRIKEFAHHSIQILSSSILVYIPVMKKAFGIGIEEISTSSATYSCACTFD
jgi:hypothetical protein